MDPNLKFFTRSLLGHIPLYYKFDQICASQSAKLHYFFLRIFIFFQERLEWVKVNHNHALLYTVITIRNEVKIVISRRASISDGIDTKFLKN